MLAWLRPSTLHTYLHHSAAGTASYALVTGATDGIGLGFAQELLGHGFNVILHGRNPTKLERVKTELQASNPDQVIHTVTADAASFTHDDIRGLVSEISSIEDINLTVLVNNVGGASALACNFQTFLNHTPAEISATLNLNILFTVHLTHALIPVLKAHSTKSLIINTSSQARVGLPYLSVYGPTKGFIHSWSHALAVEFSSFADNQPIEVLEILVGSVQSQQNQTDKPTLFVPSSRDMARSALNRVGCGAKQGIAAYWPHALQQLLFNALPDFIFDRFLAIALRNVVGRKEKVW